MFLWRPRKMNKQQTNQWVEDTAPVQVLRYFRLEKSVQGTKINNIITKSIPDAQSIVEMA